MIGIMSKLMQNVKNILAKWTARMSQQEWKPGSCLNWCKALQNDHPGKVKRKDFSRIVEDKLWENALSLATRLCLHFLALPNAVAVQEWWRFVAIIWFILFLLREMEGSIFVSLNDFFIHIPRSTNTENKKCQWHRCAIRWLVPYFGLKIWKGRLSRRNRFNQMQKLLHERKYI